MSSRELPPGDYAYIMEGDYFCPCRIIGKRGRIWTRVLRFKVYDGSEAKTVRTKRLIEVDDANGLIAFKEDPMAVLHMTGEEAKADG